MTRLVSPETKFCSVCVFLIVTPSKLFALVFDFSALPGTTLIEIAVYNIWNCINIWNESMFVATGFLFHRTLLLL